MATIIICMVLIVIVTVIIFNMRKDKKLGKSSCGSGCTGCPMTGKCHEHL